MIGWNLGEAALSPGIAACAATNPISGVSLFVKETWHKVQPVQAHISLKLLSSAFGDLAEVQLRILLGQGKGSKQVGN